MTVRETVLPLARKVTDAEGLELVQVEFQPRGKNSLLRLLIDKPGGVNLEDCQHVSQRLSVLLDLEDVIPEHYLLEVSSPGLDRPLLRLEDYDRFNGSKAKLTTRSPIDGRRNFRGHLRGTRGPTVMIDDGSQTFEIAFENIAKANLVFELKKP